MAIDFKNKITFTKDTTLYGHQSLDSDGNPQNAGNGTVKEIVDLAKNETLSSVEESLSTKTIDVSEKATIKELNVSSKATLKEVESGSITPTATDISNLGSASKEFLNGYLKYLSVQYIKFGGKDSDLVGLHNGLYRGACLYDNINGVAGVFSSLADIHTAVSAGDFSNIYIGDYIDTKMTGSYTWTASDDTTSTVSWTNENVRMVVAAIDYYKGRGDSEMSAHHLLLVPEDCFYNTSPMNPSHTTTGSYAGSKMHTLVLPAYATALNTALGGYLKSFRTLLANATGTSVASSGYAGWTGTSNNWAWASTNIRLLSEPMVYGGPVWGSSGYDVGEANQILPYFKLKGDKLVAHRGYKSTSRLYYWLSAVVSSALFAGVDSDGYASCASAGASFGVRPFVLFG